jgi:hypothetical protein
LRRERKKERIQKKKERRGKRKKERDRQKPLKTWMCERIFFFHR